MSEELSDRCPACNAEIPSDSEHCAECGSVIPGRESSQPGSAADVLGFDVVQGSSFQEEEYIPPPPEPSPAAEAAPAAEAPQSEEQPPEPATQVEPSAEATGGIELETMVDPDALEAANSAADQSDSLELESMIPTTAPGAPPPPREPSRPSAADRPDTPERRDTRDAKADDSRDSAPPSRRRVESKGGVGFFGALVRLVILLVVGVGVWVVAGAPGGDAVRALGVPVPDLWGAKGFRYVNNLLADPIEVSVDGAFYAVVEPGAIDSVPKSVGDELSWTIQRPEQPGGVSAGELIRADMPEPMVAGPNEHYRINNESGPYWIFAPLITNPTRRDMIALVNAGTGRARPCSCVIPAGAEDYHIGYYGLEAGLDIRFYPAESGYEGRYREVRDVGRDVAPNTGVVSVRIPRR